MDSPNGYPESGLATQLLSPELTLRLLRRLSSDLPRGVGGSHSVTIPQINEGIIPDFF